MNLTKNYKHDPRQRIEAAFRQGQADAEQQHRDYEYLSSQHTGRVLRTEASEILYQLLPSTPHEIIDAQEAALLRIAVCANPALKDAMRAALDAFEFAHKLEVNEACEQAFRLGFQAAQDPSPYLFE